MEFKPDCTHDISMYDNTLYNKPQETKSRGKRLASIALSKTPLSPELKRGCYSSVLEQLITQKELLEPRAFIALLIDLVRCNKLNQQQLRDLAYSTSEDDASR